jgi:molecular chaperone GrpE
VQRRTSDDAHWAQGPAPAPAPEAAVPHADGGPGSTEEPDVASTTEPTAEDEAAAVAEDLARLQGERDEFLDHLRRVKAEFDNYRKRVERERRQASEQGARDLVADLLPVMDNLERALDALAGQDAGVVAGLDMVRHQLGGLLSARGVTEIEAAELPFDPTVHEAVASAPTPDRAEGTVIAVVQKGYRLHDAVLRPARVVVAAPAG